MDMAGALRARLIADAAVNALVVGRVTWVERPQAAALPAITLERVAEIRRQHMQGYDGLTASTIQIGVWGRNHLEVSQIVEAVIVAVTPANTSNGIKFERAFVDNIRPQNQRTETAFIHGTSVDFIIHHSAI